MSFLAAITPMESNETFDDGETNDQPGHSGSFSMTSKLNNYGSTM